MGKLWNWRLLLGESVLSKKLTNEDIVMRMYELVGDEYEKLDDEYINNSTKFAIRHNVCGHKYMVHWGNFRSGKRCPNCSIENKRKKFSYTDEYISRRIEDLGEHRYKKLSKYINNKTKLSIRHLDCGFEYKVTWNHFLEGTRCPKCYGKERLSDEYVGNIIDELGNGEYQKLSKYINNHTHISIKHKVCGNIYNASIATFKGGSRCPKCSANKTREKLKLNYEDIKESIENLGNKQYVLLSSSYINSWSPITIKHLACGNVYESSWNSFQQGNRCPKCSIKQRAAKQKLSEKDIDKRIEIEGCGEYVRLGRYINSRTNFEIKHLVCGHIYSVRWGNFHEGYRCPKCNFAGKSSKGENLIAKVLENKNIDYVTQFIFDDCKYVSPLRFDFAINNANQNRILIEYDGRQHFEPVDYFGGEKSFKQTQIRDKIKNQYCKDNNIPLLRIPHWDFDNIEQILTDKLKELEII